MTPIRRRSQWHQPAKVATAMANHWGEAGMIWLDGDGSKLGHWATLAADPISHFCCRGLPGQKNAVNPFAVLSTLNHGHWCGWLSYEAAAWVEPGNPWKTDSMATLWMVQHDPILRFNLHSKELWIEGEDAAKVEIMETWLQSLPDQQNVASLIKNQIANKAQLSLPINNWQWQTNKADFKKGVQHIRELIAKGDLFQANLSVCCQSTTEANSALEIFQKLRQHCPAPFAGLLIGTGDAYGEAVISSSPERFLQVKASGEIETRPIKGTRPRSSNPETDADIAADLICSVKDRAENVMIVDLLRNDLGRICEPGSIDVSQLVGLESYAQVHHLTSVIKGKLQANANWVDLLKACWPGGSISGAPKLRACQRLHELEPIARGPYCGSILHLDWDGHLDSNILIRSLLLKDGTLRANAGCGIVIDSDPDTEAEELNWKLMPLLEALR